MNAVNRRGDLSFEIIIILRAAFGLQLADQQFELATASKCDADDGAGKILRHSIGLLPVLSQTGVSYHASIAQCFMRGMRTRLS